MRAEPGHDGTKITHKVTVESGESTTSGSELGEVGELWVGVWEESDQQQPTINPMIYDEVENVQEAPNVDAGGYGAEPSQSQIPPVDMKACVRLWGMNMGESALK